MVFRLSTTKIVSRPIAPAEVVSPEITFIAIDTYIETSRKDEFIIGNLFDYNGNKINYIWDAKKGQTASLKGKNLNTEVIFLANEFLKNLYRRPTPSIDVDALTTKIVSSLQGSVVAQKPKELATQIKVSFEESDEEEISYMDDDTTPVFSGEFLSDDEEPDDFDEQLALKSQEFLKEHPELKSEMEIVRLLEGN